MVLRSSQRLPHLAQVLGVQLQPKFLREVVWELYVPVPAVLSVQDVDDPIVGKHKGSVGCAWLEDGGIHHSLISSMGSDFLPGPRSAIKFRFSSIEALELRWQIYLA